MDQKRSAEAIAAYQSAIRIKPDFAWAYYFLGKAYRDQKRYTEARAAYQNAARLDPTGQVGRWAREALAELPSR